MNHDEIANQAALYVSRRDEPEWSAADEAELQSWLAQSHAHKAAFWRLSRSWEMAGRLAALGPQGEAPIPAVPWWRQRKALLGLAASVALLFVGVLAFFNVERVEPDRRIAAVRFETPVGGRKSIKLADGSVAELNTATRVRAEGGASRQVWLDDGEAFFKIAHDAEHPFVVHAGRYRVTVLGTSFAVRRTGPEVTVSVAEGRVRVDDMQAENTAQRLPVLGAGQMAILRPSEALVSIGEGDRVERALAWRDGMLSFDSAALADVVADFNRYNERKMTVADSRVAGIRITGAFKARNTEAFLRLLQQAYGLRVDAEGEVVKISD